ncbi:MAG: DUF3533 domain-containing protein [Acidimicrobiia bacterium]
MPKLPAPTVSSGRIGVGAVALGGAFLIAMLFMASYVGALHNPQRLPHQLPLAVGGPPAVAGQYRAALESFHGGGVFDVRTETSVAAARTAVLNHDVYAAIVPASPPRSRLIVAEASGPGVADDLATELTRAFRAQGHALSVERVVPLPSGDSRGVSPFYAGVSWVFAGYLGAIVLSVLAGAATSRLAVAGRRAGALLLYAIACGLVGTVILDPVFGALTGHFLALWGLGTLVVFSVAAITSGLQGLLGFIGTGAALLLFLVASNPSAGGAVVFPALPGFWRTIGPWLPTGAATTLLRNTVYFGGHNLAHSLVVLIAYAVIGIGLLVAAGTRRYTDRERDLSLAIGSSAAGA